MGEMETALLASSVLSNGAFIGVSAFFVKRWMDKKDTESDQARIDVKNAAKELADDLKQSVREHQAELKETACKLEGHLDRIYEQLRIANGRTAKLEGGLIKVEAVCSERHAGK
jgi:branched-subunit amino acid aminotransferase/4-amino-4-deoxychorismate lyase